MATPLAPLDLLRLYINDPVPTDPGQQPMFTDAELNAILVEYGGNAKRAAADAWRWKAAKAASLVDVTEGNASRAMSDMHGQFMQMMKMFETAHTGPTEGRTRIGKIRRRFY